MKILFVEKAFRTDKLGVCILSAILKKAGHEVELLQSFEDIDSYLSNNKVVGRTNNRRGKRRNDQTSPSRM